MAQLNQTTINNLREQYNSVKKNIATASKELTDILGRRDTAAAELLSLNQEIESANKTLEHAREAARIMLVNAETKADKIQRETEEKTKQAEAERQKAYEDEKRILNPLNTKKKQLEKEIAKLEKEPPKLASEAQRLQERVHTLKSDKNAVEKHIKGKEKELHAIVSRIDEANDHLEDVRGSAESEERRRVKEQSAANATKNNLSHFIRDLRIKERDLHIIERRLIQWAKKNNVPFNPNSIHKIKK